MAVMKFIPLLVPPGPVAMSMTDPLETAAAEVATCPPITSGPVEPIELLATFT